jgi:hypothetical protein
MMELFVYQSDLYMNDLDPISLCLSYDVSWTRDDCKKPVIGWTKG